MMSKNIIGFSKHRFHIVNNLKHSASLILHKNDKASFSFISKCPKSVQPYLNLIRADKQIGTLLLLYPTLWGLAIGTPPGQFISLYYTVIFTIGSLAARSAGCAINDMTDKDIDKSVERTRVRPLANGDLTMKQAGVVAAALIAFDFGLAYVCINEACVKMGLMVTPLVIAYPWMKRIFPVPQFVLGLVFNSGVWFGFSAITNTINPAICLPLYIGGIAWTILYDTFYAFQDIEDDKKLGIKSSAIFIEGREKTWLTIFVIATMVGIAVAAHTANLPGIFYGFWAIGSVHLAWQVIKCDIKDVKLNGRIFRSNNWFGMIILLGIIIAKLYQNPTDAIYNKF